MSLKLAYLGAWHSHAVMHVREAAARPDEFELLGMFDPDPDVISGNRARWGEYGLDIPVFDTEEAVLDCGAEAVIVEGHIYENLDYAERALQAGLHVLLEKPAGVDVDQLERVHSLAEDSGLCLQMAYMWRYNPAIRQLLKLAGDGALGQIFQYRGHIPKPKSWHPQLAEEYTVYHGGVYFEMAGHLIDLLVALLGEPGAVHAALGRHYGDRSEVDNAMVVHECANGLGLVDTTAMQIGMDRRIEVHGTGAPPCTSPWARTDCVCFWNVRWRAMRPGNGKTESSTTQRTRRPCCASLPPAYAATRRRISRWRTIAPCSGPCCGGVASRMGSPSCGSLPVKRRAER